VSARLAAKTAIDSSTVQAMFAVVLALPLVATAGQYLHSGFLARTTPVAIVFWPGATWQWAPRISVAVTLAAIGAAYLAGVAALLRSRSLTRVVLLGFAALAIAKLVGFGVERVTGWADLQSIASLDLAGRVDRAIFALWHDPVWEELVFRGAPLVAYRTVARRWPSRERLVRYAYVLVPAVVMSAYHIPGHGYARIADTFVLSAALSLLAIRYGFASVLVLHCLFDAMMVISLPAAKGIPVAEVEWLAEHSGALNTTQSLALLGAAAVMALVFVREVRRGRAPAPAV
jgi:hypothetical protein